MKIIIGAVAASFLLLSGTSVAVAQQASTTQVILPLTPGLSCQDASWCLAIMPNGDLLIGTARPGSESMRKRGNVLDGLENRSPRSFVVNCSGDEYCIAVDSFGNWYSGSNRPGYSDFFQRR